MYTVISKEESLYITGGQTAADLCGPNSVADPKPSWCVFYEEVTAEKNKKKK